jgi:hypothetical protein
MIYIVEENGKQQTYKGFNACRPYNIQLSRNSLNLLAIAQNEDNLELWWAENKNSSIEELQRYYRGMLGKEVVIKVFQPV